VPVQLAIGMPTEVVNHREDNFSGGTATPWGYFRVLSMTK
jgi:hypothetical protein